MVPAICTARDVCSALILDKKTLEEFTYAFVMCDIMYLSLVMVKFIDTVDYCVIREQNC